MFSKEAIKSKVGKVGAYSYSFLNIVCKAKLAKLRYESIIIGKVGKVGDTFGNISLLFRLDKVGKVGV